MLPALSGCSAFQKEYVVVTDYVDDSAVEDAPNFENVASYSQLRKALSSMVSERLENAVLRFNSSYSGDILKDLSTASWSIRAESALGAWCVERISYDVRRIVSYYEADVVIEYKRTFEEMASIVHLTGTLLLNETIQEALRQAQPRLILRLSSNTMDEDQALAAVQEAWFDDPTCSAVPPSADIQVYSGQSLEKIVDIYFSYDYSAQWLEQLRLSMEQAANTMLSAIPDSVEASAALYAFTSLADACQYDMEATDFGETAYGALVIGRANSLGYAQAYKLLCDRLEIPCQIISGRYNHDEHFWNIIELDGQYYHVDVSLAGYNSPERTFLRTDSDFWGPYWWLIDEYPPCDGTLTYAAVLRLRSDGQEENSQTLSESS